MCYRYDTFATSARKTFTMAAEETKAPGGETVVSKALGDPGAEEREDWGRRYLVHGAHSHTFEEWVLGAWKLCPKNDDLRTFIQNLYADLEASVGQHQPPEVRQTGRINFFASNITQYCRRGALGDAVKRLEAYAAFKEVLDEANVINENAFKPYGGVSNPVLLVYVQQVSH